MLFIACRFSPHFSVKVGVSTIDRHHFVSDFPDFQLVHWSILLLASIRGAGAFIDPPTLLNDTKADRLGPPTSFNQDNHARFYAIPLCNIAHSDAVELRSI